jgi:glycosyltransferase involved in cell wall biosynthesis
MPETVSIALATYDGARFLPEQLESFRRQTHPPHELVVGDDGSSDGSLEILETFKRTAPFPVRITRNPRRLGFKRNFLATAARTRGTLVAFSDQDDVWADHKLERCAGIATDHPGVMLVNHRARIIDAAGDPVGSSFPDRGPTRLVRPLGLDPWTPAYGLTMVVRRQIVELATRLERPLSFDLDGSRMAHDEWLALLARSLFEVAVVDEDLVDYRSHATNVMGPPVGGRLDRLADRLRFGASDYRRHEALYASCRRLWGSLAEDPAVDPGRLAAATARDAALEAAAGGAAEARAPDRSRLRQVASLARMAVDGGYRRRAAGGLGSMAFARDVLAATLAIDGSGAEDLDLPEVVVERIVTERRDGESFDRIAAGLARDGVHAPALGGWRGPLVHRVAYLHAARSGDDQAPVRDDGP